MIQTQIIRITLPKDLVKQVDVWVKKKNRSRNELICEAVQLFLAQ